MADDPIKHVIVLCLENRSFDQMLGCFKEKFPDLDGIDPAAPQTCLDDQGNAYTQRATTLRQMPNDKTHLWDPHHEVEHVHMQIEGDPDHPAKMKGFVFNFAKAYPDSSREARQYIMDYYPRGFLPGLHSLAEDFTVCDRWFSSLPGPTWPNRFFALSGTASGRVAMPSDGTHHADLPGFFGQNQETIFDRLNEKGIHWKTYFHDLPQSWVMRHPRRPNNAARYFYIREFYHDARGPEEEFPQFCYIEPDFMGFQQNDDHPPHDVMKGEKLIVDVYNALRSNPKLWASSLLVVFFDEHGGFYDHVYPPAARPPDHHREEYTFDQLGVRVPALLVSPHVERRVEHTQFDHTSLLRYLIDKWELRPLGERTAKASSIAVAIREQARDDTIAHITMTVGQLTPPDPEVEDAGFGISGHHRALRKFSAYLKAKVWTDSITAADERLPALYPSIVRIIEVSAFATVWTWRTIHDRLRGRSGRPTASISQPDKVHVDSALQRDDAAYFLIGRKRYALGLLGDLIKRGGVERRHAIRTLAAITGRPFHEYEKSGFAAGRAQQRAQPQTRPQAPQAPASGYVDAWVAKHVDG